MAIETQELGNFSIQDTMEFGMGNQALVSDFLSPETVTASTDDIKVIPPQEEKKKVQKVEPKVKKEEEEKKDAVNDFLEDDDSVTKTDPKVKEKKDVLAKEGEVEEENEEPEPGNEFGALSKDLFKLGVFTKDEEEDEIEISSPEQFLARFNFEKKKGAMDMVDRFIGQFGQEYQEAFDAIYVKGVDPKEYFGTYNNIQSFTNLDLKDELNQVAVVKQALLNQGFEAEDITSEIERIKNYGDLESVATKHHKVLVKNEQAKLAELEQESQNKLQQLSATRAQYQKKVDEVLNDKLKTKEFDGIPINQNLALELRDFLVTEKYQTSSKEKLTEFDKTILDLKRPENHEKKVKFALLLKILEKDPTLSTIQKAGITKKTDTLFGELARQEKVKGPKQEKVSTPTKSWFS